MNPLWYRKTPKGMGYSEASLRAAVETEREAPLSGMKLQSELRAYPLYEGGEQGRNDPAAELARVVEFHIRESLAEVVCNDLALWAEMVGLGQPPLAVLNGNLDIPQLLATQGCGILGNSIEDEKDIGQALQVPVGAGPVSNPATTDATALTTKVLLGQAQDFAIVISQGNADADGASIGRMTNIALPHKQASEGSHKVLRRVDLCGWPPPGTVGNKCFPRVRSQVTLATELRALGLGTIAPRANALSSLCGRADGALLGAALHLPTTFWTDRETILSLHRHPCDYDSTDVQ